MHEVESIQIYGGKKVTAKLHLVLLGFTFVLLLLSAFELDAITLFKLSEHARVSGFPGGNRSRIRTRIS